MINCTGACGAAGLGLAASFLIFCIKESTQEAPSKTKSLGLGGLGYPGGPGGMEAATVCAASRTMDLQRLSCAMPPFITRRRPRRVMPHVTIRMRCLSGISDSTEGGRIAGGIPASELPPLWPSPPGSVQSQCWGSRTLGKARESTPAWPSLVAGPRRASCNLYCRRVFWGHPPPKKSEILHFFPTW